MSDKAQTIQTVEETRQYIEIEKPSFNQIVVAIAQCGRAYALIRRPEAAIVGIGDAVHLHDFYNVLDEAAAMTYAKRRKLPIDTFSSRATETGKSEYPEDVVSARKRRTPQQSAAIDKLALDIWRKRGLSDGVGYPYEVITGELVMGFYTAHTYLADQYGELFSKTDAAALESNSTHSEKDVPSARLFSWISAYFLVTHKDHYLALLEDWVNNIFSNERLEPIETRHPEIKTAFFEMLNAFCDFHLNRIRLEPDTVRPGFNGALDEFIARNMPDSIYFPNVTEDTYKRFVRYFSVNSAHPTDT